MLLSSESYRNGGNLAPLRSPLSSDFSGVGYIGSSMLGIVGGRTSEKRGSLA